MPTDPPFLWYICGLIAQVCRSLLRVAHKNECTLRMSKCTDGNLYIFVNFLLSA